MPLEMPRVGPRHQRRPWHLHQHHMTYGTAAATAAARPDEEEDAQYDRRDSDTSSAYSSDDEPTPHGDMANMDAGWVDADTDADACCGLAPYGHRCCAQLTSLARPVEIGNLGSYGYTSEPSAFWTWPVFGPLLFENTSSDVRDGLANERTFLSYLRLSVTMAVVAVAIVLSFHLKNQPSQIELRMARPLGIIFWLLSVLTLFVGIANYIKTVNKYSRRQAIVQSGWKTQSIMGMVAFCIFGSCVTLLVINKIVESRVLTT